ARRREAAGRAGEVLGAAGGRRRRAHTQCWWGRLGAAARARPGAGGPRRARRAPDRRRRGVALRRLDRRERRGRPGRDGPAEERSQRRCGVDPAVTQDLRSLFEQWLRALPPHDLESLDRTIAAEGIYTDVSGTVRTKAEYLEIVPGLIAPDHKGEVLEFDVRLYADDVALATGHYTSRGRFLTGVDYEQDSRFTA